RRSSDLVPAAHVWARIARSLLEGGPRESSRLSLTRRQEEGARQATTIQMRYGGVIIADSVGMGKTYVALRMIADALARDWRVVVVVPATLRRKWRSAIEAAGAGIAGRRQAASAGTVTLRSQTRLARSDAAWDGRPQLAVDDEAHQFRNPRTARYRALARLTADAYVVLLTATPINNRAADLYWLRRLF